MRVIALVAFSILVSPAIAETEEEILKTGGDQAELIIDKAYEILIGARVFSGKGIGTRIIEPGVMGAPTEECWALTVIVRYDENAGKRLAEIIELTEEPIPILYCVLGLCLIDESNILKFPDDSFKALLDREVKVIQGCISGEHTFRNVLTSIRDGNRERFIFEKLHRLYQTSRASLVE